jgi:hypothetical protein
MGTKPDIQPGRVSEDKIVVSEHERWTQLFKLFLDIHTVLKRIARKSYNYECPVDEYETIGLTPPNGIVNLRRDFQADVQYECIVYSLPLGTTTAALNLGASRSIPLYNGAATIVQQAAFIDNLTIQVAADDRCSLSVAGALTSLGYIGLMGHTIEKGK